jgi:hypothetical protein
MWLLASWQLEEEGRDNFLTQYILYFTKYLLRTRLDSYQVLLPKGVDCRGLRGAEKGWCLSGAVPNFALHEESLRN